MIAGMSPAFTPGLDPCAVERLAQGALAV